MKYPMRNELEVPAVVDRGAFGPSWMHCGFERKLTHEKATRLQPPADGCPWSRWKAQRRSLANAAR